MSLLSQPVCLPPRNTTPPPGLRRGLGRYLSPLLLVAAGLASCARAPVIPPAPSTPAVASPAADTPELFAFHVSSWVNLHQQLFFDAHPPPGVTPQLPEEERWTPAERQAWDTAVATYRERTKPGSLTLIFDETLIALRRALDSVPEDGSLSGRPGIDPAFAAALEQAMGPYRAHYWPEVSREAQAWVASLKPALDRSGQAIARELSEVYGVPWPSQPFSVQVCRHAGGFGAYTLVDPTVITLSNRPAPNRQETPLETVFHEASHALNDPLTEALHAEFRLQGKTPPRMLWHALLFFTTGEVVRHHLGADYVPYASLNGLYARNPEWAAFEPVMRAEWTPYLERRVDRETALRKLVAGYLPPELGSRPPAP
jgi:hypothetical protein